MASDHDTKNKTFGALAATRIWIPIPIPIAISILTHPNRVLS